MHLIRLSHFLYRTVYTLLFLVLTGLLLITPADIIRQAQRTNRLYDVVATGGIYFLTLVGGSCIYASRLYTNRSVLGRIPRGWIPVERSDVGTHVEGLVKRGLKRSREVRSKGRPRDVKLDGKDRKTNGDDDDGLMKETETRMDKWKSTSRKRRKTREGRDANEKDKKNKEGDEEKVAIDIETAQRSWGSIEHHGWSGSATRDYPDLHYGTVVGELLNIIEAKAVALASSSDVMVHATLTTDPSPSGATPIHPETGSMAAPDPRAVEVLQRPAAMGMRDYLAHLISLGVISTPSSSVANFLIKYEYARFSEQDVSEDEFRELMSLFAEILRGMRRVSGDVLLAVLEDEGLLEDEDDEDQLSRYESRDGHLGVDDQPSRFASPSGSPGASSPSIASSASTTQRHPPQKAHATTKNRVATRPQTPSSISLSIYSHHSGVLAQPDDGADQTSSLRRSSSRRRSPSRRRSSSSLSGYASSVIVHRPPPAPATESEQ